jgi:hypothetical protein
VGGFRRPAAAGQATRMTTILIIGFVVLLIGYMILYGLWSIFLWLTEYDGLYWLTIVFGLGSVAAVVILVVWSARQLSLL